MNLRNHDIATTQLIMHAEENSTYDALRQAMIDNPPLFWEGTEQEISERLLNETGEAVRVLSVCSYLDDGEL